MYVILGLGAQGKAILRYLLQNTDEEVLSFDTRPHGCSSLLEKNPDWAFRWKHEEAQAHSLFNLSGGHKVVISCLPTQLNADIAISCATRGWSYLDLGGKLEHTTEVMEAHDTAKKNRSTIVPDCGIAPGLVSTIAGHLKRQGADNIKIYCGGLPENPESPLKHIKAFSSEGVIKEYTGIVEYRNGSKLCYMPALSQRENIYIKNLGFLEAEPTTGSVSLLARLLDVNNLIYKTLRYPGHWDYVKQNILNQPNPIEILDKMIEPVGPSCADLLVLYVEVDDVSWCKYIWRYDYLYEIGAMAQITGYTAAAVAKMIHAGELDTGVVQMHNIDWWTLEREIKLMDNQFAG